MYKVLLIALVLVLNGCCALAPNRSCCGDHGSSEEEMDWHVTKMLLMP